MISRPPKIGIKQSMGGSALSRIDRVASLNNPQRMLAVVGVSCRIRGVVDLKGIELEFVKARTAVIVGSATDRQKIARAALERGHPQIASNLATRMVIELRCSLRHRRSLLGRELLGHFEQLQTRTSTVVRS